MADGVSLMDLVNSGATPQTQALASSGVPISQIYQAYANPDAVLGSPAAQAAMGLSTAGGGAATQALRDLQQRIITGVEGLTGEAKYAALRQIAQQLQGDVPSAGASLMPADMQKMQDIMSRIWALRQNPLNFK